MHESWDLEWACFYGLKPFSENPSCESLSLVHMVESCLQIVGSGMVVVWKQATSSVLLLDIIVGY